MRRALLVLAVLVLMATGGFFVYGCGDSDGDGCPGIVCSNCGASGDCDVTCSGEQVSYCGHFGLFEDDNLRCAFCESPDFEF